MGGSSWNRNKVFDMDHLWMSGPRVRVCVSRALRSGTTEKVKQIALVFLYQLVGVISTMLWRKNDFLPMLGSEVTYAHHKKFLTSSGPRREIFSSQVMYYVTISNKNFETTPKCLSHLLLELFAILYPRVE